MVASGLIRRLATLTGASFRSGHGERLLAREVHLVHLLGVLLRPCDQGLVVFRSHDVPARAVDDFLRDSSFRYFRNIGAPYLRKTARRLAWSHAVPLVIIARRPFCLARRHPGSKRGAPGFKHCSSADSTFFLTSPRATASRRSLFSTQRRFGIIPGDRAPSPDADAREAGEPRRGAARVREVPRAVQRRTRRKSFTGNRTGFLEILRAG